MEGETPFWFFYIAIPQSMTIFCPVMDLLNTKVLICSATSSGDAVDLSADFSVVALTLASGNLLPLCVGQASELAKSPIFST
jgi:hypothetical protein